MPLALGWVVVAVSPEPSLFAAAGISPVVLVLLALSLALAVVGLILLRQRRRGEQRALSEAEGGRAEAERRAHTDALTGLYSRRHVVDAISAELARSYRTGVPPSVLMLDLDNFKRINGVYGHEAGDRVLSAVARRLQGRLRGYDVLGCWGGDDSNRAPAPGVPDDATLLTLAEQIRRLVGELPVAIDEETLLPVTVSVGAVRAGEALRSVEGLVDCANRALAAAKRLGSDPRQLFGDLTVEDLVAEEPEPIRLARALSLSSSARSDLPRVDAERVSDLAAAIAGQMGLGSKAAARCRVGGLLHDIGTAAVPDRIGAGRTAHGARPARVRGSRRGRRAPRSGRGGCQRGGRDRGRARGVLRRHRLSSGASGAEIPLEGRIVALAIASVRLSLVLDPEAIAAALERQSGAALDPGRRERGPRASARDDHSGHRLRDVPTA